MAIGFADSARRFLRSQPIEVASEIIDQCVYLSQNPYLTANDLRKSFFDAPPAVMVIYRGEFHWISYYEAGDDIVVANIGANLERPHLWRPS